MKIRILVLFSLMATTFPASAISINTTGAALTEDFNTLASTGTSSTVPAGWAFSESGTSVAVDGLYTAGAGSSGTGDTYSFGTGSNVDRAFGTLLSGTISSLIGVQYQNLTGGTIASLDISYTGEEWRLGTASRADRLDFQYSLNATSLTTGTWTDFDALDFSTPNLITTGSKDGNVAANQSLISASISGLNISGGSTFWLRWTDFDASGADDGLAVDNFSLTARGPTPPDNVPDGGSTIALLGLALVGMAGLRRKMGL